MKPLLEKTDKKYQRRMVREINSLIRYGKSVYGTGHPYNHVIKKAHLSISSNEISCECIDKIYRGFSVDDFFDGYGSQIVASRESL